MTGEGSGRDGARAGAATGEGATREGRTGDALVAAKLSSAAPLSGVSMDAYEGEEAAGVSAGPAAPADARWDGEAGSGLVPPHATKTEAQTGIDTTSHRVCIFASDSSNETGRRRLTPGRSIQGEQAPHV
jgi:hypothetical protein